MFYTAVAIPILIIVVVNQLMRTRRKRKGLPLPPGPEGLPIVGNAFQMPVEWEHLKYMEWGKQYGDIIYLTVFSQPFVVLNSAKLAIEMLEKKSAIYSDRPRLKFGGEMVGWNRTLALLPYGSRFREFRRLMHQAVGGRTQIKRFDEFREKQTHKFLKIILQNPEGFYLQLRKTISSIVLNFSHGYEVEDGSDPVINKVEDALNQLSILFRPQTFLVDALPFLRFLPAWFPGAGFKNTAKAWRRTLDDMTYVPWEYLKARMANGTNLPNYSSGLLENERYEDDKDDIIKWSASSLYSGGSDTTVPTVRCFWFAMTLYPEVQRKAQEELDRVVGTDRLPTFADRENLPYLEALVTEVHRWNPVAPMAIRSRGNALSLHALRRQRR
ncbi:hypothetical protein EIP86_011316 [Pleurotus ostreatoroseus]|nr:hypothetical protein EIP86_011316 [Pleurotus ostreatoroseus]